MSNSNSSAVITANSLLPAVLRLSLKKKWFDMTKAGIKTEDYRELNEYWHKRLFTKDAIDHMEDCHDNYGGCIHVNDLDFKKFDCNVMTLGYPSNDDTERILKLQHKGIEIRTGNPEWRAEPNKLYFVILHGAVIA